MRYGFVPDRLEETVARTASRKEILEGPIVRTMFRLAWPLMISSLLHYLYNMADTFWVGHLPVSENASAVAGLQIAGPVIFFLMAFAFGFNSGGLALVSQYMGAHRKEEANTAAAKTLSLSIAFGLFIMVTGVIFSPALLRLLTSDPAVARAGTVYTRIIFIGMPFEFVAAAYAQVMAAYGDTITPMLVNLATVIANIVLDPFMIFGWGPFARMTVAGAAVATIICQAIAAVISLVILFRGRHGLRVSWRDLLPDWFWYRRILKIGLPASIGVSGTSFGFLVLTGIIGRVPNATVALSAYGIGDRFINISFVAIDGLSLAISTMVGHALGGDLRKRANSVVWTGTALMFGILVGEGTLLRVFTPWLFRAFIPTQPAIISEGVLFMSLFLPSIPFFGIVNGVQSAFQGSGHNTPPMIMQLVRLWGLRVPLSWFFGFAMHMGSRGIWTGMLISNVLAAVLALVFLVTVDWHHKVIEHTSALAGAIDETGTSELISTLAEPGV
ncbi:MATE family efflux transporter [Candidatus Cryosericum odellii]|jgi:putative MATE family efflux protein|uniref:MATE family efflux transporter n=1 Tax=Candidatus Cryosericum odellii TaxID=2290917 RepID=A0A398D0C0_9BACT|nr:MATE family efflux transporter [Candidatus Cryosericum odellii]RIE07401.1 MATE family efflux transporter [Candidatus Cryosericum odellii]RIE09026.1 MATE family efflux transporter [Candidatus Cryosericum odellii]